MHFDNATETPLESVPVLDEAVLRELFEEVADGIPDVLEDLIATFVEDGRAHLEKLERALEEGDTHQATLSVHSLKSSGATFGAHRLSRWAAALEGRAREGDLAHIQGQLDAFRQLFERTVALLWERRPR